MVYLRNRDSLDLITDGKPKTFNYGYGLNSKNEPKYFIYLPSTHEFDLQLNAHLKNFASDQGVIDDESRVIHNENHESFL